MRRGVGVARAAEGRDTTNLIRLITKRGSAASRRERKVALTFDDGPVLQTHQVLETLEHYGVKATFFLVGRKFEGHEDLVRRMQNGGHEIGNHSFGHSPFPALEDVAACSAVIEHVTGRRPKVFRPPFGAIDTPGAEASIEGGMQVILWSVDSKDSIPPWTGISPEEITRNVLRRISPGSIVLLHDGLPWSRAADALPTLIEGLLDEGYQLVTVSELLAERRSPRGAGPRRLLGWLQRKVGSETPDREPAKASTNGATGITRMSGAPPTTNGAGARDRARLRELLERLADDVEPPEDEGAAAQLIRGGCVGLAGAATGSDLLARHVVAYESNAVLVIALGFSVRRFEREHGNAVTLPPKLTARLQTADDPAAEAGLVAQELGGPRRHHRLMAAHIEAQAAEGRRGSGWRRLLESSGTAVAMGGGASPDFQSIFGPGAEVWDRLASWARETGEGIARRRMRTLLDRAGIDGNLDLELLIDRLDVDFLFRFGYALAACEEVLP